jgi:hypothetical protein
MPTSSLRRTQARSRGSEAHGAHSEARSARAPERNTTVNQEGGVKQRARESERVPRCSPSRTRRVALGVLECALGSQSAARSGPSPEVAWKLGFPTRLDVGPRAGRSVNQNAASCPRRRGERQVHCLVGWNLLRHTAALSRPLWPRGSN